MVVGKAQRPLRQRDSKSWYVWPDLFLFWESRTQWNIKERRENESEEGERNISQESR